MAKSFNGGAEYEKHKINEHDTARIISTITLNGYLIDLGEDTGHERPFYVETRKGGDMGGWVFDMRTDSYIDALKAYSEQMLGIVQEMQLDKNVDYKKLTAPDCLQGSDSADFTKQLIIVNPASLMPEYRSSTSQLIACSHGNGARPNAKGRSVFGNELYSGTTVVYDRSEILGIADVDKLPQWAKVKLEIQRDPSVFEFGGYHFKPIRQFKDGEVTKPLEGDSRPWKTDNAYAMRNMTSDFSLSISAYDRNKADVEYSHVTFYEAAKGSKADIFKCIENGKLYVPGANELFLYNEPTEKELRVAEHKALKEYGLMIDEAIKSGVDGQSVPLTLELLDARFGKEKTDELLATVALTSLKDDGRISSARIEWAKSVITDMDSLKSINIKAHPAHFDNLLMYAASRDLPEQEKPTPKVEKPDLLAKISGNKQRVERNKITGAKTPAKKKNRGGQEV